MKHAIPPLSEMKRFLYTQVSEVIAKCLRGTIVHQVVTDCFSQE